jgi:Leucine-rich repeat (LRR) protein
MNGGILNKEVTCGMKITELYDKLKEAYSNENLTKITVTLINLYQEKQYGTLGQIAEMISETVDITIDPEAKYFSKLMMLYHPDRGDYHRHEIDRHAANNNFDGLLTYSHILMLGRIEEIAVTLASYEDIDYSPVYEWDINADGFTIISDAGKIRPAKSNNGGKRNRGISFYDAVKIRMYGKTTVEFPPYYLEDMDEIELAQSEIDDLDGVQYCIHVITMDLSGNSISDISWLWGLSLLEEINLSDNKITDIDTLSNLKNLRTLNLSNNTFNDISPLMNLNKLEYVDLSGSKVPLMQIKELEELGVTVIS